VPDHEIVNIRSVMTILGGKVVHGNGSYAKHAPDLPKPMPDWSPVGTFGSWTAPETKKKLASAWLRVLLRVHGHDHAAALGADAPTADPQSFWVPLAAAAGLFEP
jgi:hypothetical protein